MVQAVKRFVSGFVLEPVVMRPTQSLADLDKLKAATGISTASWWCRNLLWSLVCFPFLQNGSFTTCL